MGVYLILLSLLRETLNMNHMTYSRFYITSNGGVSLRMGSPIIRTGLRFTHGGIPITATIQTAAVLVVGIRVIMPRTLPFTFYTNLVQGCSA